MNNNYKKTLALLVAFGTLLSVNVWAVGGNGMGATSGDNAQRQADIQQKMADKKAEVGANICDRISERADSFNQKMTGEENKFQTRNQERLNTWTDKKMENETKLNSERATWDANRDAQFKALEDRAQTEEQKKAVADFETTTRTAIEARRVAVDASIKTFQEGVQAVVTARNGQVDQLLSGAKSARQVLLETAKADCVAGKDAKTVMVTFRSGMQANRTGTQADKQNIAKVNTQVQALITTRKSSVDKAFTDFKAVMEQARIALKKAFPSDMKAETTPVPVQ